MTFQPCKMPSEASEMTFQPCKMPSEASEMTFQPCKVVSEISEASFTHIEQKKETKNGTVQPSKANISRIILAIKAIVPNSAAN